GYHTEHSGMRWSFFFLAEYASMLTVSAIATTLFLGGWLPPFPNMSTAVLALVGGVVFAAVGYGAKRRGFDGAVGFFVGSGLGVLAGVLRAHFADAPAGDVFLMEGAGRFAEGLFWFMTKVGALLFLMMWLRWTLPRYRVDQLMDLCWKKLTPLALINLVIFGIMEALLRRTS
ncbi:MAG TPA: complex I subunit 1 family protein, partial [Planctomycetota bacterium]|nr:complex I subunit 1 family protein [Planctomycetota bacterium]